MDLEATLRELDAAIATVRPDVHRDLAPGASDADIERVRAAYGRLPAIAEQWYRWHAGSDEGIVPGESWGLLDIDEIVREPALVPTALAQEIWAPLLTSRDGGMIYVVERPGEPAMIMLYDRGDEVSAIPFDRWLRELLAAWQREPTVLRVAFLRLTRSPMGWHMLTLPTRARKRLTTMITHLPMAITDGGYVDGSLPVRIAPGDVSTWKATHEPKLAVELVLGADAVAALAKALADRSKQTVAIPGLDDVRFFFADR